jgi:Family of unknown function (DUF7033)
MIIYSDHISPRFEYVCSFLFGEVLGQQYLLTNNPGDIDNTDQDVLVYSKTVKTKYFTILPHSLLFENEINEFIPDHKNKGKEAELFPNKNGHLSFDILAATFYMISRYEEYLDFEPDKYNRFTAKSSLAFKLGFLREPIVNIWAIRFALAFQNFYPSFKFNKPKPSYLFTIDIDIAWDIRNKGFIRTAGAFLRSHIILDYNDILYRIKVLNSKLPDRFDAYDRIREWHKPEELKIFVLLADRTKYDRNINYRNPEYVKLIRKLSDKYELGIHPSYNSSEKQSLAGIEMKRLEEIIKKPVKISRQHFLRFRFPKSYRMLINAELTGDYSMVFADQPGFRAGTSLPFDWYDLKFDEHTKLRVHPSCLMDRSMKDYLKLNAEESQKLINEILNSIKEFGGVFIPIFHNDSVNGQGEWEGWDKVYVNMLKQARQL